MESSITCLIKTMSAPRTACSRCRERRSSQAALSHSNEMVDQGYFEHTSPAGLSFMERIEPGRLHAGCPDLDGRGEPRLG